MSTQGDLVQVLVRGAMQYASPEARAAYLDGACGADLEIRAKVEARLRECTEGATQPEPGLGPMPELPELDMPVIEKPGDRIGRYRLLQKLGEGGFGVVYMAEQEEPVRRRVALKVIKLGMDTRSVVARFEAERQALALMDHPGIARVLDGGVTSTGRPFFVMELVKGMRITEYCDHHKLSTRERLELFMQVCHAIQHAHQKGIIHRDIKPSNILVTVQDPTVAGLGSGVAGVAPGVEGGAQPKVIDFGIAKAMDRRLTEKTFFTELDQFIGTPAYVSPEQAEMTGLDIDTRSDIYSLGVLLYELLTGRTPFDTQELMRAGIDEIRRRIREEEPPRPSTRLTTLTAAELDEVARHHRSEAGRLPHALRGDLDWIAMKALEKDRTRRYATANALVMDIQRHLNHEPVTAVAPGAGYRLKKFARRNRVGLTVAGAMAAALVLGAVASVWQALRAEASRRDAEKARQVAETNQHEAETARQVAEANRREAEKAHRLAVTNRLEAEKLITFMLDDLGTTLEPFARLDLMEPVIEKTAEYYRNLPAGEESDDSEFNRSLSLLHLGRVHFSRDEDRTAESNLLAALRIQERLLEKDPASPLWQMGLAKTESWLAWVHAGRRNEAERSRYSEHSHSLLAGLAKRFPDNIEMQRLLGLSFLDRAGVTAMGAKPGEMQSELDDLNQAIGVFQSLTNREPSNKEWQAELGWCYNALGGAQERTQRQEESRLAFESYRMAADLLSNAVHGASQNLRWRSGLGNAQAQMAYLESGWALWEAAEYHALAAKRIFEELLQEERLSIRWIDNNLGQANNALGRVYMSLRGPQMALPFFRESWRTSHRLVARNPRAVPWLDSENAFFREYQSACVNLIQRDRINGELDRVRGTWLELARATFERSQLLGDTQASRSLLGAFDQVYNLGNAIVPEESTISLGGRAVLAPAEYVIGTRDRIQRGEWVPRVLIGTNAVWRFRDNGEDPGTEWTRPSWQGDGAWGEGPAILGYGEATVATQLYQGARTKPIATYFRKVFVVDNPESFSTLFLRVMVDDGAVFFVNGREMLRVNMPQGNVDRLTLAGPAVETSAYTDYLALDCALQKTNVLAVEVHQCNVDSSDLVFGVELHAGVAELAESLKPRIVELQSVFIQAAAYLAKELQSTDASSPVAHRVPKNYDQLGNQVPNRIAAPRRIGVVVPSKSEWRYQDDGSDLGTAWKEAAFNDRVWKRGSAPLGYPEPMATVVSYGDNPRKKPPTLYLRKTVVLAPTNQTGAWLARLLVDDGAIVYWNGREVLRHNMASGEVTFSTLAAVSGNTAIYLDFVLPGLPEIQATNVLAVEVHQRGLDNVDLAFDLELVAGVPSLDDVLKGANIQAIRQYLADQGFPMPEELAGNLSSEASVREDSRPAPSSGRESRP